MADTSNQEAPPRKTLQNEIDFLFGKAGGYQYSFVVRDKKGDCKLPPFVNVRFIGCEISSLQADSTNILYFVDCTFTEGEGKFTFNKSAIIAEACEFKNKTQFTECKLQLLECDINQTLTLKDVSYLKSIHCTWEGTGATKDFGIILDGSRLESYDDSWGSWNKYSIRAKNKSFAKITSPSEFTGLNSFVMADTKSGVYMSTLPNLEVTNTDEDALFFIDNSVLEIYNALNISSKTDVFYTVDSKIIIRGVDKIESTDNGIGEFVNSVVDISQTTQILAQGENNGEGINATDSDITIKEVDEITTSKSLLILDNTSFLFIGAPFEYNDDSAEGSILTTESDSGTSFDISNGSIATFKNVKEINSSTESSSVFILDSSNLSISNCNTITGLGDCIFSLENDSDLLLDTIKTVENTDGIFIFKLYNKCRFFVDKVGEMIGQNSVIYLDKDCSGVVSNFEKIESIEQDAIKVASSSLILKNCTEFIKSQNAVALTLENKGRANLYDIVRLSSDSDNAISISGKGCYLEIKNILSIVGNPNSIEGSSGATIIIDNSEISGTIGNDVSIQSETIGTHSLLLKGPLKFTGSFSAQNYILDYTGITFEGDVSFTNCIVTEKASTFEQSLTVIGSTINSSMVATNDVDFTDFSVINGAKYTVAGTTTITNSSVSAFSSKFEDIDLSNSVFSADASQAGTITATDAFVKTFGGTVSSMTYAGVGALLGGAMASVGIDFSAGDPSFSSDGTPSISTFFAAGQSLGLEAEETILLESNKYQADFRATSISTAVSNVEINSTNNTITIEATGNVIIEGAAVNIQGSPINLN